MKNSIFIVKSIVFVALVLLVIGFVWIMSMPHLLDGTPSTTPSIRASSHTSSMDTTATRVIYINGQSIIVDIADTPAERQRGLSGRADLAPNHGMLFIFPSDGIYAFWMKDMRFSIDIIWLSADGTVITIAQNISPRTYPHTFAPSAPAQYVVELPAGFVQEHHVQLGDKVQM
jgi:hypothetical protein